MIKLAISLGLEGREDEEKRGSLLSFVLVVVLVAEVGRLFQLASFGYPILINFV